MNFAAHVFGDDTSRRAFTDIIEASFRVAEEKLHWALKAGDVNVRSIVLSLAQFTYLDLEYICTAWCNTPLHIMYLKTCGCCRNVFNLHFHA